FSPSATRAHGMGGAAGRVVSSGPPAAAGPAIRRRGLPSHQRRDTRLHELPRTPVPPRAGSGSAPLGSRLWLRLQRLADRRRRRGAAGGGTAPPAAHARGRLSLPALARVWLRPPPQQVSASKSA